MNKLTAIAFARPFARSAASFYAEAQIVAFRRRARRTPLCVWRLDAASGGLLCVWTDETEADPRLAQDNGEPPPSRLAA
ncbi:MULTISPECIES: hypothetical protein [Methylosinus]|uniref:Uncharacterized protein n=1 Tax=Methylosinus trichosporium (strain ATCC 35070 / NCIMB 11131 / UNIQEM 75 / OB3b) TaxID=595536 RepID=A0A2D2CYS8_METT3|nr:MULTISPECIES: hypothetical protein [Methylosinus]ATQ67890.1 hypothetical protein CQW49_08300 [Methylosinus trichosporium OB3b]OBS54027.1 hypothetical protein A8B73_02795 [Methylosinus sp. 3S-1]